MHHQNSCRWRCRSENKLADRLCNKTMDLKKSWLNVDEVLLGHYQSRRATGADCQIISFSDGGTRDAGGGSAAAWVVVDALHRILASKGIYMGNDDGVCSFTAEVVALESVLEFCREKFAMLY